MLKPGLRITVTDEVVDHLDALGVAHDLEYGEDLIVVSIDDAEKFPVQVSLPGIYPTWKARIHRTVAEFARAFYEKQMELLPQGEGVSCPLPVTYWYAPLQTMTDEERVDFWARYLVQDDNLMMELIAYGAER